MLKDPPDATAIASSTTMSNHGRFNESASQIGSMTAFSEPAFPTVYRREKESGTVELNNARPDGSISMFSNPAGETLLSQDRHRDKRDKLAPMPENRRLGYLSVAALIINKMIGMPPVSMASVELSFRSDRNWNIFDPEFCPRRHWRQQRRCVAALGSRLC